MPYDNTAPTELSPPDQWVNIRTGGALSGALPTELAPGSSFQGVTLAQGDSFFATVALQAQNGIYVVGASSSSRRSDANAGSEFRAGRFLRIREGNNAGQVWFCTNQNTPSLGPDALTFAQASPNSAAMPLSAFSNAAVDLAIEPGSTAGFSDSGPGTRSTATHIPAFSNAGVDIAIEPGI